jgi:hypothetical protein
MDFAVVYVGLGQRTRPSSGSRNRTATIRYVRIWSTPPSTRFALTRAIRRYSRRCTCRSSPPRIDAVWERIHHRFA